MYILKIKITDQKYSIKENPLLKYKIGVFVLYLLHSVGVCELIKYS